MYNPKHMDIEQTQVCQLVLDIVSKLTVETRESSESIDSMTIALSILTATFMLVSCVMMPLMFHLVHKNAIVYHMMNSQQNSVYPPPGYVEHT